MAPPKQTLDETREQTHAAATMPGLVVVTEASVPSLRLVPLVDGRCTVGREGSNLALEDDRVSREHAEVTFVRGAWTVRDLGSRNGTDWNGRVVRFGQSLVLLEDDIRRFADAKGIELEGSVVGPTLRQARLEIDMAAADGATLLVTGESGTGKELAAQRYHAKSAHAAGPKIDLNCAAIPHGVAESILFGAARGAFTGAVASTTGCIAAADGGVLFLDEVGELDLEVQAKLLRVLETKEVAPIGSVAGRKVDVFVCAATNRDLREQVAAGRFRADLYYRLAQREARLPPLRERLEEVPFLIAHALAGVDVRLKAHAKLVEACLLRPWPGNVRELLAETKRAARHATARGVLLVGAEDLDERAGKPLESAVPAEAARPVTEAVEIPIDESDPERLQIVAALAEHDGNVAAVARALGWHRTQLYRAMKRHRIPGK